RPPDLASTRTSPITAVRSTALIMSTTVRAATVTAVSASISTPVRSVVRTVASTRTPSSWTSRSTATRLNASGWHSGTSSEVRLAPWMPAIRATASTSPFGAVPSRRARTASGANWTKPSATASRAVTSLSDTSTIRACPASSRWVSPLDGRPGPDTSVLVQQPDRHDVAGVHLCGLLVQDDEAVAAGQVADQVRPVSAGQPHRTPVVVLGDAPAGELPLARHRVDVLGCGGRHRV